jgi:integrase
MKKIVLIVLVGMILSGCGVFEENKSLKAMNQELEQRVKLCIEVGLLDVTFDTLRHTFATRLAQHNVNTVAIQKLMGHKSISMTERYSHHSIASLVPFVEQLSFVNRPT